MNLKHLLLFGVGAYLIHQQLTHAPPHGSEEATQVEKKKEEDKQQVTTNTPKHIETTAEAQAQEQEHITQPVVKKPQKPPVDEFKVCHEFKEKVKKMMERLRKEKDELKKQKHSYDHEEYEEEYGYISWLLTELRELECVSFNCIKRGLEKIKNDMETFKRRMKYYEERGKTHKDAYLRYKGRIRACERVIELGEAFLRKYGVV